MMSVVAYRRALHRIPELDDRLPETCAYVHSALASFELEAFSPIPSSVCAYLDAGKPETVAFRADMDALPIEEATGLAFASGNAGVMHACGHDANTAMVLALAEYAAARREELPRNVLFLFQPSEETTGGAQRLCETGILGKYRAARVFAMHLWPKLEQGEVYCRPGPIMARSNEVTVTLTGKSVHIGKAPEGIDALAAGAEYLLRAYAMAEALPGEEPVVLRFGKMASGSVRNAISGKTVLEGSLRTFRDGTQDLCRQRLEEIGREIALETGCGAEVFLNEGYPAVWNHEGLYETVRAGLGEHAPRLLAAPTLTAEDFSFYQRRVPGLFFLLGTGDTPELHSPEFCFDDEAVLPAGVEFLKRLLLLA
ncbi:M20 family metallopeptidase [uncultured Oscillibacter sp.]|uniref:M20 metallopeptidase family protein n=1 Tax=uncultured Oscillibacter sp. TaxID=876091 RepID=UPI002616D625|nr:M20 family metallopeptidase [uncultured Oscillibacter sp.]